MRLLFIIALALLVCPLSVMAEPGIPYQFYGEVNFSNGLAPNGLVVETKIGDDVVASATIVDGKYGYSPNIFFITDPDNERQGKTIRFFVSGIDTNQTVAFTNGGYSRKDLTIAGSVGAIEWEEDELIEDKIVAIAPSTSAFTSIKVGESLNITISSDVSANALIEKIQKLESGNVAVLAGNNLLNAFEIKISGENLNISVTMSYDDSNIDENTITPFYFDGTNWIEIDPFSIDKSANKITFSILSGGTPYAVFGQLLPPPVEETAPPAGSGGQTPPSPPATPIPLSQAAQKMDMNQDGKIDIFDFNTLMVNWGREENGNIADFDDNSKVDIFDFNLLMIYWTG